MNQCDHLRFNGNRPRVGCGKVCMSMKMGVSVDGKLCLRSVARKKADFMAEKVCLRSPAKIKGIFLAGWFADKKETPSKGCLCKVLRYTRLLVKCSSNVNSACNCTTYHRVVTDSEESHQK